MLQLLKILLTYISLQQKLVCYSVSTQKLWQKFSLEFFKKKVTRVMQEKVNNSVIAKCFLDPLRNLGKPQGNYCKKKKLATAAEKKILWILATTISSSSPMNFSFFLIALDRCSFSARQQYLISLATINVQLENTRCDAAVVHPQKGWDLTTPKINFCSLLISFEDCLQINYYFLFSKLFWRRDKSVVSAH